MGVKPYKLKSVHILVCLNELVDIPIDHPFRNHCKELFSHRHSQQREHIWMAEGPPCYNFLAECLRDRNDHQIFDTNFCRALGGDSHL